MDFRQLYVESVDPGCESCAPHTRSMPERLIPRVDASAHDTGRRNCWENHEQERQRARMPEYRRIVASGNVGQFALQLARRPEHVA
jgi:hypothetical protein